MSNKNLSFEEASLKLEEIVQKLESNVLTLDESVNLYKEGIELSLICDTLLKDAEEKISVISEKVNGDVTTEEVLRSEF